MNFKARLKKLSVLTLSAALVLPSLQCPVLAQGEENITVALSQGGFLLPPEQIEVSPSLASDYGYDDDPLTVSALDAMVKIHELMLADAFTTESAKECLSVGSGGYVSLFMGTDSYMSYFVNDAYVSTTPAETLMDDNDYLHVFFYQDEYYDYYSLFDQSEITAAPGEEFTLTLKSSMAMMGYMNPDPQPVSGAVITAGTDFSALADTTAVTDENGEAVLSFAEEGVYYVSARSDEDYITPPRCTVTITAAETTPEATSEATPEASPETTPETTPEASPEASPEATPDILALANAVSANFTESSDPWAVMDMFCGGYTVNYDKQSFIDSLYAATAMSDTEKYTIALAAAGENIQKLTTSDGTEFDAVEKIASYTESDITYPTAAMYAMLIYDSGDYTSDGNLTRDVLLNNIFTSRSSDGTWGYEWNGVTYADYDTTALALNVFATYYGVDYSESMSISRENYDKIQEIVPELKEKLSALGNANTDAMVIIGLCAIGETDAAEDVLDELLTFALDDNSGFGYTDNTTYNAMATEQALRALIAYIGAEQNDGKYNVYSLLQIKDTTEATASPSPTPYVSSGGGGGGGTSKITVTVTLKGDSVHGDEAHSGSFPTWISKGKATVVSGSTAAAAIKAVLKENGYTAKGVDSGYITAVTTPDGETLAEFDNGKNSGWLYTVNGDAPNVGISSYTLASGDAIVLYYTDDYTSDTTESGSNSGGTSSTKATATPAPTAQATATPQATAAPQMKFKDVPSTHWAWDYIEKALSAGFINGYDDETFMPDKTITRAELMAMLFRIFGGDENSDGEYSMKDVSKDDWFCSAAEWCAENEYVIGDDNGYMHPSEPVTREDLCVIVDRVAEKNDTYGVLTEVYFEYSDGGEISDYAQNAVQRLSNAGIVSGEDGAFLPKSGATRAQVCKMLCAAFTDNK